MQTHFELLVVLAQFKINLLYFNKKSKTVNFYKVYRCIIHIHTNNKSYIWTRHFELYFSQKTSKIHISSYFLTPEF